MTALRALGWDVATVGELDHRLLRAPSIKLRAAREAPGGTTVYSVDLRLRRPNAGEYLTSTEAHSIEHFLLEGYQRLLPAHFVSVGVMGCQTGFYLILLDEGRYQVIADALERILEGVLEARAVPYADIGQCGNFRNHDLARAQAVAREVLAHKGDWRRIV